MSLDNKHRPKQFPVSDQCIPSKPPVEFENRPFTGNRPIAYLDDLAALHGQVLRWLIGPGNDFGHFGYVPLLRDGTIDPSFIRQEFVGVDVFNNAELIDANAKTIEFRGNLVKVFKDIDGKLVIYIKQKSFSHLGTKDGNTDGNMYLDRQSFERITPVICPIGQPVQYNGFQPGQKVPAIISRDPQTDVIIWQTKQKITFKDNCKTKFVISLVKADGTPFFTVESSRIYGNSSNVIMGDNRYCSLEIFEFTKEDHEFSGKIRLFVNLAGYIKQTSKFNVLVTHYNSDFDEQITTWKSKDLMYVTGEPIDINMLDLTCRIDTDQPITKEKVCGITYINDGYIKFTVTGINNINNGAISFSKLKFESNILEEPYEFRDGDIDYIEELPLSVAANNITWRKSFKIKKDLLYPLNEITAKITLSNAFCTVQKTWTNVRIKYQTENAYINTCDNENSSSKNVQAFDGNTFVSEEDEFNIPVFANLTTFLEDEYLQIIPDYGLVWPNLFGVKDSTKGIRYYKRIFTGDDTDTSLVWGGTFEFGNLTKRQFFARDFKVEFSLDFGQTWYQVQAYKDGNDPLGVLTKVEEQPGKLFVTFALPENQSFNHTDIMQVKITMNYTNNSRITYIKLRNQDNTKQF